MREVFFSVQRKGIQVKKNVSERVKSIFYFTLQTKEAFQRHAKRVVAGFAVFMVY